MLILLGASNVVRMNTCFPLDCLSLATSGASVSYLPTNPHLKTILKEFLRERRQEIDENDILILLAGTNDFLRGVSINHFKENFRSLLRLCRKHFNKIVLAKIPSIPRLPNRIEDIKHINRWMQSFALNSNNLVIADTFEPFVSPILCSSNIQLKVFEERYWNGKRDGVHLNAEGLFILKCRLLQAVSTF